MPMSSIKLIKEDNSGCAEPSTVAGISAFLGKLWKMVEDPKTDDLIAWGKSGNSFVIKNQINFAKTILPNYYKHNNIASFIRQLNMYGFHKIISTTSGALDSVDNDEIEFTHPNFVRGRPYLLEQIKRKMNNPKENIVKTESGPQFNESIKRVLVDIKHLKGKQESLSSQFCAVKQENEILWRELSLLRQKHAAQQNILNKLIRFLVSLAQPANHSMAKRRLIAPLMLKDSTPAGRKQGPIIHESGDHMYTMKKRDSKSPGPTIHEIHSSDAMNDIVIDSPEVEVPDDASLLIESDIEGSPDSNITIADAVTSSMKPVPAALLRSDMRGKKRIQKVYITPDPNATSHFLISQPTAQSQRTSEYLVPEQTDNPFLELVHETETDNENDYVTVLAEDDDIDENELLTDSIPATMIADNLNSGRFLTTAERGGRRKERKSATRGTNVVVEPQLTSVQRQKLKVNSRKKTEHVSRKEKTPNTIQTDDFLYDIDLQSEPSIKIRTNTPKPNTSATSVGNTLPEFISLSGTSPNTHLQIDIPLIAEEVPKVSPNVDSRKVQNVSVSPNLLLSPHASHVGPVSPAVNSPIQSVHPISPLNPITPLSPLSPVSPSTNAMSPNSGMIQHTLSPGANLATQPISPRRTPEQSVFLNQMNECIDDAQNMKIACTTDSNQSPPTKGYAPENFRNQLDCMQTEINSLKELMQNEGLTLDVNTLLGLFTEDPMDYNLPSSNLDSAYKSNDDKIMGNEVISASSPLDFNDIFSNEWNQPTTPLSAYDSDYYALNTPQIERNTEEPTLSFAPPSKKIKS